MIAVKQSKAEERFCRPLLEANLMDSWCQMHLQPLRTHCIAKRVVRVSDSTSTLALQIGTSMPFFSHGSLCGVCFHGFAITNTFAVMVLR